MKHTKLWHSFISILGFFTLTALIAGGVNDLSAYKVPWGFPFGVGAFVWIIAIVFYALREKSKFPVLFSLPAAAIACGLFIGSFLLGKHVSVKMGDLLLLSVVVSVCYLIWMGFMSVNTKKDRILYQVITFIAYMGISVAISILLSKQLLPNLKERGMLLLFFLLILAFLSAGSLLEAKGFQTLWSQLALPAFVATGIVAVIVIAILSEYDSCDCGDCGDGCSHEKGNHNGASYTKKKQQPTTMDGISKGEL